MCEGNFAALCTSGFDTNGICLDRDTKGNVTDQLYDPYSVNCTGCASDQRVAYPNNVIPTAEFSTATTKMWDTYFPAANTGGTVNNYLSVAPAGGNTNEFVARGDQNISDNTRLFGRFTSGLTDLPVNPFGTGLCLDRCAEKYHSKLLVFGVNHTFTPTTILDVNFGATRLCNGRQPLLQVLIYKAWAGLLPTTVRLVCEPC